MQLGRTWTALIIVQVAFTVAVLPGAIYKAAGLLRIRPPRLPPTAVETTQRHAAHAGGGRVEIARAGR